MNRPSYIFSSLLFALTFFLISCSEIEQTPTAPAIQKKSEPIDYFFLQRASSGGTFNFKAYKNTLQEVARNHKAKARPEGLEEDWISRGPSNIGARINTIAIHPNNENVIYTGFSAGGIFKSEDDGTSWRPIFDDNTYLSIGDIAIDPNNSSTIYVGTGDPNVTGYPFVGDGVYKSTDAGETWDNIGLQAESIISKIAVNPNNSNIIYASALGSPFVRNDKRGLYKSTDAGATWSQVLFVSTEAGISDFVLSPTDPNTIYAAAWNRIRNNHESIVAGADAKIFKSTNGGQSWTRLEGGLPLQVPMGRIGLAISHSNPNKLYASFVDNESELHNIFKTTDGGISWSPTINWEENNGLEDKPMAGFGWYFGKISVNPANDEELYLLGVNLWKSTDGGTQWQSAIQFTSQHFVHADKHDLVFTPSGNRLLATDGGLYKTDEEEFDWIDHDHTPTTQFYRVAYNPHIPNWYFGGSQDNGSIGGENEADDWLSLYGGDGFQLVFHPDDPAITYAESQNGNIAVTLNEDWSSWNVATNGIIGEDRRNWDMPFFLSPHNPSTMYTGTYRVYKSTEGPIPNWYPVSEDLTDGQIFADRFHTISAIAESKPQQGLVYVGTTDGNIWRSDYGGDNGNWIRLSTNLPDDYVTAVVPSPDNIDKVYVSFSGYKENDNSPKIFKSDNRGNSWQDISGDLPSLAINDLFVLPMHNDSVIIAATDGGIYITGNSGAKWYRMGNMPIIPVYDVEYNGAQDEVIAGTFGRSIMTYSLEDINSFLSPISDLHIPNHAISISPNPASKYIDIAIKNSRLDLDGYTGSLVDMNGKIIHPPFPISNAQRIDLSQVSSGVYFLVISKENQLVGSTKFIKY